MRPYPAPNPQPPQPPLPPAYADRIAALHRELGLPAEHPARRRLPLQPEATELVDAGPDTAGRPRQLSPEAATAWFALRDAARADSIELVLVSAFRSVDYQRGLIERKRARGLDWDEILRVSAPPGHSEHHTGRAIDVTTPGVEPLSEPFEITPAFAWLTRRAGEFGFHLSYPRDNPYGIIYEPWHWLFQGA